MDWGWLHCKCEFVICVFTETVFYSTLNVTGNRTRFINLSENSNKVKWPPRSRVWCGIHGNETVLPKLKFVCVFVWGRICLPLSRVRSIKVILPVTKMGEYILNQFLKFEHSKGPPVHAFALQENNRHIKGRRQT